MWSIAKYFLIAISGCLILFLSLFYFTPSSFILNQLAHEIQEKTGRKLVVTGGLERHLYPNIGFTLGSAQLSNAAWAQQPHMAEIETMQLSVRLLPLLTGAVEIEKLHLIRPVLHLVRRADNTNNWDIFQEKQADSQSRDRKQPANTGQTTSQAKADISAFALLDVQIEQGKIYYEDAVSEQSLSIEALNASAHMPSIEAALIVDGAAQVNQQPVRFSTTVDSLANILTQMPIQAVAKLEGDGLALSYEGQLEGQTPSNLHLQGRFSGKLDQDRQKTAWLREALGEDWRDIGGLTVTGSINASDDILNFEAKGETDLIERNLQFQIDLKGGDAWLQAEGIQANIQMLGEGIDLGYTGDLVTDFTPEKALKAKWHFSGTDTTLVHYLLVPAQYQTLSLDQLEMLDLSGNIQTGPEGAFNIKGVVGFNGRIVNIDSKGHRLDMSSDAPNLDISLSSELFLAHWQGRVNPLAFIIELPTPLVDGHLDFKTDNLQDFTQWLSLSGVNLAERAAFYGDISLGSHSLEAQNSEIQFGDLSLTGDIVLPEIWTAKNTRIDANLTAKEVWDLRPLLHKQQQAEQASAAAGARAQGTSQASAPNWREQDWRKEPWAFDLKDQNIRTAIKLKLAGFVTDKIETGEIEADITTAPGQAKVTLHKVALYDGLAQGVIEVDHTKEVPQVEMSLSMETVALEPLLRDSADINWLEGAGSAKLDLQGQGNTMDALAHALKGKAAFDFYDGMISGFNLAGLARNAMSLTFEGPGENKTDFTEISAEFVIAEGIAHTENFILTGPLLRLSGEGDINIGAQSLDLYVTPKAVPSLKGQGGERDRAGLAFPLKVTGSWHKPKIRPDLSKGAVESVETILADPKGAALFLKAIDADLVQSFEENNLGETLANELQQVVDDETSQTISEGVQNILSGEGQETEAVEGLINGLFGN